MPIDTIRQEPRVFRRSYAILSMVRGSGAGWEYGLVRGTLKGGYRSRGMWTHARRTERIVDLYEALAIASNETR